MRKDFTQSKREEREEQQHEDLIFSVLNKTSVAITAILGFYLIWSVLLGLSS